MSRGSHHAAPVCPAGSPAWRRIPPAENVELAAGFDAFGENRHIHAFADREHGADDGTRLGAVFDLVHERAVELDLVEREGSQRFQRRVTGTEVIERDGHTQRLDLREQRKGFVRGFR
jgi:hypothetical protein